MHTLVADDDGIFRFLLSSALRTLGHTVSEATNGREALAAWRSEHPALIISDWMMPDLDGLELCRQVRAGNGADFTYIILLTSRRGKTNYLRGMEAGPDDFMNKPFEQEQFAAQVRVAERILDLHENLRTANDDLERRVVERTAELGDALAAKSEFLSRASHELRTPMHHVLGFAQLLARDAPTTEQAARVGHILTGGQQLLGVIDRILEVAQSGTYDLSFLETSETARRGEQSLPLQRAALSEPVAGRLS